MKIKDTTALVAGATRGIGLTIARKLAACGARLIAKPKMRRDNTLPLHKVEIRITLELRLNNSYNQCLSRLPRQLIHNFM